MATLYTPLDIITLALGDTGEVAEGQLPSTFRANQAYIRLQLMLSQWQRKRWLIWHLVDLKILSTGAKSYTIGPAGSDIVWDPRPDRLESAFLRQVVPSQPNLIDYPLELIQSWEDYSRIALKTLGSFPDSIFLDTAFPQATLYPWPVPQASIYEVHVQVKEQLKQFTGINEQILLPEEYIPAIEYNLALRLFPSSGFPTNPDIKNLARDSLNVLRTENAQIASLTMPDGLGRPGIYNIYSDQIR